MVSPMREKRAWPPREKDADAEAVAAFEQTVAVVKETVVRSGEVLVSAKEDLSDHKRWLEAQRATETENYAIGSTLFSAMLKRTEGVDIPLDRLMEIGQEDLERNLAALDDACHEFAPDTDRQGCTAKMKSHRPKGGAVEGARAQLATLLHEQCFLDLASSIPAHFPRTGDLFTPAFLQAASTCSCARTSRCTQLAKPSRCRSSLRTTRRVRTSTG